MYRKIQEPRKTIVPNLKRDLREGLSAICTLIFTNPCINEQHISCIITINI